MQKLSIVKNTLLLLVVFATFSLPVCGGSHLECGAVLTNIINHPLHHAVKPSRIIKFFSTEVDPAENVELIIVNEGPAEVDTSSSERWDWIARGEFMHAAEINPEAKRILVLSDGAKSNFLNIPTETLGQGLSRKLPQAQVISGDLLFSNNKIKAEGYSQIFLDNTQAFLFSDNSFDLVLAENTLCHCSCQGTSCGGISYEQDELTRFLSEASRILNKKQSKSAAILQAKMFKTDHLETKTILRAANEVVKKYPVRITIAETNARYRPNENSFSYVLIQPR